MRQSSDPEFTQILNLKKGSHTDDVREIKPLADTDTFRWSNGFANVYLINCLANNENERCIENRPKLYL